MQVTLSLERMIHSAKTIARLDDGRIALVTGGLPGERVEAFLENKKGVLQGSVTAILEASEDRQEASEHPGLNYSHIKYKKQLELKASVLQDALSRSLKRELSVPATRAAPELWHYRHAIQPVVTKEGLGYRKPESHDVVLLERDPVASEALNAAWQQIVALERPKGIRELVMRSNDAGEVLVSLIASASARNYLDFAHKLMSKGIRGVSYAQYDARGRFRQGSEKLTGRKTIRQRYGAFDINVSTSHFAQPNPSAASLLYENLVELAPSGKKALDLYAGSGIIGMHLAHKFDEVLALDIDKSSVTRGEQDAKRLGITNLSFIKADAKKLELPERIDLITVDPPRAGLNKDVRALITSSTSPVLIYVSCDVATWARDIAEFEKLGWALDSFEPFDFYPHTHHVEILSVLIR